MKRNFLVSSSMWIRSDNGTGDAMSLSARQCRALDSIEQQLRAGEPRLASMFAIFTTLNEDELLPAVETIQAGPRRRLAELIAGLRPGRLGKPERTSRATLRLVNVALVPFIAIGLLTIALVLGSHGSPGNRCSRMGGFHSFAVAAAVTPKCGSSLSQPNH